MYTCTYKSKKLQEHSEKNLTEKHYFQYLIQIIDEKVRFHTEHNHTYIEELAKKILLNIRRLKELLFMNEIYSLNNYALVVNMLGSHVVWESKNGFLILHQTFCHYHPYLLSLEYRKLLPAILFLRKCMIIVQGHYLM